MPIMMNLWVARHCRGSAAPTAVDNPAYPTGAAGALAGREVQQPDALGSKLPDAPDLAERFRGDGMPPY